MLLHVQYYCQSASFRVLLANSARRAHTHTRVELTPLLLTVAPHSHTHTAAARVRKLLLWPVSCTATVVTILTPQWRTSGGGVAVVVHAHRGLHGGVPATG